MSAQDISNPFAAINTTESLAATRKAALKGSFDADPMGMRAIGMKLGQMLRQKVGSKEDRDAARNTEVVQKARATVQNKQFDSEEHRQEAVLTAAIKAARDAGRPELAAKLVPGLSSVQKRIVEKEKAQADLLATKSSTKKVDKEIERLDQSDPSNDALTRAQNRRESWSAQLDDPNLTPEKQHDLIKRIGEESTNIDRIIYGKTKTQTEDVTNLPVKAEGALYDSLGKITDVYDRVDDALADYDPEQFTTVSKMKGWGLNLADMAGLDIPPDQKKFMVQQTLAVQKIASLSNETVHQMSGAAVTPAEWERIRKQVIDIKHDGPVSIQAKLNRIRIDAAAVQMRLMAALEANEGPGGAAASRQIINGGLNQWKQIIADKNGWDAHTGAPAPKQQENPAGEGPGVINFNIDPATGNMIPG
jgi:hypothetical protein